MNNFVFNNKQEPDSWESEKELRTLAFDKKGHDGLHGRTGRRRCPCYHCNDKASSLEGK